ncbi:Gfo/Idh/MocA family oxidoreductase [Demequina sp. B12]|uniref:Gfo/Idh/MocA family protein n=1 Tax=Demequina sp. B12 TaxID=2992757 RepID=UPI00237A5EB5|nr:Gfo/Idh/MocA family oxidoreductase [Demequina sp. B12]MDE0572237.1 Gfo/Idh/MocA family oxidoreductase [Demequina sp. B12]
MANLRVGLAGVGMMGRHHARVLRGLDGIDLVGIADAAGDAHGVAAGLPVHESFDGLLEMGLDYVMIAVPTHLHEDFALKAAAAGVHAMVEKPLAPSPESAERVTAAFKDAGLVGAVGHIERYNPALQQLRARLAQGDLGEMYQVVTRRQGPFPARIADVGVVKDLATHDIDLTAWVTQSEFATVAAQAGFRSGREHEDLIAITGRLANDAVTSHLVNWLSPIKERLSVVTGERGAFVADTLTADLYFYANGTVQTEWDALAGFRGVSEGDMVRFSFAKPEPLKTEHEAFRDAVLGKDADIVTMEQGLATVRVADAVLESARSRQTVTL